MSPVRRKAERNKPIVDMVMVDPSRCEWARKVFDICNEEGVQFHLVTQVRNSKLSVKVCRRISVYLRSKDWSFPDIGRLLNRHHTNIIYLVSTVESHPQTDDLESMDPEGQGRR